MRPSLAPMKTAEIAGLCRALTRRSRGGAGRGRNDVLSRRQITPLLGKLRIKLFCHGVTRLLFGAVASVGTGTKSLHAIIGIHIRTTIDNDNWSSSVGQFYRFVSGNRQREFPTPASWKSRARVIRGGTEIDEDQETHCAGAQAVKAQRIGDGANAR